MRFRVTSITGTEEDQRVNDVTIALEDALNGQLSQRSFGSNIDQISIVVVSAFNEIAENEKWAASHCKLSHVTNEFTAERIRVLSFGVAVNRKLLLGLKEHELPQYLSAAILRVVSARPKRVAAGLDYSALSSSIEQVVVRHAKSAA